MRATKEQIREKRLLKQYNLSQKDYDAILANQGGGCGVCGKTAGTIRLSCDHEHDTGLVRGILCWKCNRNIGRFGDDICLLVRAALYLSELPARHAIGLRWGLPGKGGTKKQRKMAKKLGRLRIVARPPESMKLLSRLQDAIYEAKEMKRQTPYLVNCLENGQEDK